MKSNCKTRFEQRFHNDTNHFTMIKLIFSSLGHVKLNLEMQVIERHFALSTTNANQNHNCVRIIMSMYGYIPLYERVDQMG